MWGDRRHGVDQLPSGIGVQERLVLVLTVEIDQVITDLAEESKRYGDLIHEHAITAVALYETAHDQYPVFECNPVFIEERRQMRSWRAEFENAAYFSLFFTRTYLLTVRTFAQEQADGIHEYRLASTCLSGEYTQAVLEFQLDTVDER